jgi:phasin family protein
MTNPTPLSEISRSTADAAARFTRISLDSAERAFAIQLEYAKGALTQATLTARAFAQVKDVETLLTVRNRVAENAVENLIGYSRSLYEVASDAQSELSRLAEERLSKYQSAVIDAVDQASKSAPGAGDVAMAAVKSTMVATTAAFDSLNKAARQVASYADAGVKLAKPAKSRK